MAKWVTYHVAPGDPQPDPPSAKVFDVSLAIFASDGNGGWRRPQEPETGNVNVGVPVRLARVGRVLACVPDKCDDTLPAAWQPDKKQRLALQPDQSILQLGRLYTVPVRGGIFKSEGAVIALDSNGIPTSIEASAKTAVAAAATGALSSAAPQIMGIPKQISATRLAETQAQKSQLDAQASLAISQAAAPSAAQVGALTAKTTVLNAEAAEANAQAAFAKAQAALP